MNFINFLICLSGILLFFCFSYKYYFTGYLVIFQLKLTCFQALYLVFHIPCLKDYN